jgi:transposase
MEACASAHGFARELEALGHRPRIIAPEFVRPFRLSGKNDANDASAICAAVRQPPLRFVAVKRVDRQARLAVHRLGQDWQEERTAGLDRLRGLLSEFGRDYPNSARPRARPFRWPCTPNPSNKTVSRHRVAVRPSSTRSGLHARGSPCRGWASLPAVFAASSRMIESQLTA